MNAFPIWTILVLLILGPFFKPDSNQQQKIDLEARKAAIVRLQSAIGCTPDWSKLDIGQLAEDMIPLPGSGNWKWQVSTTIDSAQFYFNQGINLYYAFHIVEAVPSFRKAQSFDPNCAMLYWGEALALGPNINDIGYTASIEAYKAVQKAKSLLASATPKEVTLIQAMEVRYSNDTTIKQAELNVQYANSMEMAARKYSDDPDVSTLYADALMLLHPWDFWNHDGTPKTWTPEIVTLLEKTLKKAPLHPGANHYYIHAVEASNYPGSAKESADRLGSLAPSLAHLVHMPSHIYIRTGEFKKGIEVNIQALKGYEEYKKLYPSVETKADLYDIHNKHMQAACALYGDDYTDAQKYATDTRNSFTYDWLTIPVFGYYLQYCFMTPEFVQVRFKNWDEILANEDVPDSLHYAKLLQSFSKGLAFAAKKDTLNAESMLGKIDTILLDNSLAVPIGPMNAPRAGGRVARHLLAGAIAESKRKFKTAAGEYARAVDLEDAMIYSEPKDWLLPARIWQGRLALRQKKWELATQVFTKDLQVNPNNYLSLKGLAAANSKTQSID